MQILVDGVVMVNGFGFDLNRTVNGWIMVPAQISGHMKLNKQLVAFVAWPRRVKQFAAFAVAYFTRACFFGKAARAMCAQFAAVVQRELRVARDKLKVIAGDRLLATSWT